MGVIDFDQNHCERNNPLTICTSGKVRAFWGQSPWGDHSMESTGDFAKEKLMSFSRHIRK